MIKKLLALLIISTILSGTIVMAEEAAETVVEEVAEEAAEETVERNYSPEEGTGWLSVKINDEVVEFEYTGTQKGMTGSVHSFEADRFSMLLMFNKKLEIGTEMETNAVTQIEIMSSQTDSSGYYFSKKSSSTDVTSKVLLAEATSEEITQGTFEVVVLTADRYVGDTRPGILPQLDLTEGEFCFYPEA